MPSLNIFACADRKYEDFALLFIASCLWSNPGTTVEIGVEDTEQFAQENRTAMSRLRSAHGEDAFLVRDVKWRTPRKRRIVPNTVRFLNEPVLPSQYIYISDIDIVTLQSGIADQHLTDMERTGLPYSNWVRTGRRRLTGLHFARKDWHFPLPAHDDLNVSEMNDEEVLYTLVERKLGSRPPEGDKFRPVHGIHMSPNRSPTGSVVNGRARPGWVIGPHRQHWRQFRDTETFRDIEPCLTERIQSYVVEIDEIISRWAARTA